MKKTMKLALGLALTVGMVSSAFKIMIDPPCKAVAIDPPCKVLAIDPPCIVTPPLA